MRIEEGLHVVTAPNPGVMTGSGTNQYLVGRERATLIDVPLAEGENRQALEAELRQMGAVPERVVVTHIHPDHLGGARQLADAFGVPLGMHASRRGFEGIEPDEVYDEGDVLEADGFRLEVLHTPGHESGHCCFFEPRERWLFTGDHVVGEGTVVIAPPDGDMGEYIESLERLLTLPARILLGGHGPVIPDPQAKIREYIDHRLDRERQVLEAVDAGIGHVPEIVRQVYRGVPEFLHPVAEKSVEAHLIKLDREGRVVHRHDRYVRA